MAERLLNDQALPITLRILKEKLRFGQMFRNLGELVGRGGEVEKQIATEGLVLELFKSFAEGAIRLDIAIIPLDVMQVWRKSLPLNRVHLSAGELVKRDFQFLAPGSVILGAASKANNTARLWQLAADKQVIKSRNEFSGG